MPGSTGCHRQGFRPLGLSSLICEETGPLCPWAVPPCQQSPSVCRLMMTLHLFPGAGILDVVNRVLLSSGRLPSVNGRGLLVGTTRGSDQSQQLVHGMPGPDNVLAAVSQEVLGVTRS